GPVGAGASRMLTGIQDGLNKLAQHSPAAASAVTKINNVVGDLGPAGIAAGAGLLVAGGAVAGFAAKGVQAFSDYTAQALKVQRVTGATAEDSSKLAYTLRELGLDVDSTAPALGRFGKNIDEQP